MRKCVVSLLVIAVAVALFEGCGKKESAQQVALTKESAESTAAGIVWSYPSGWTKGGARPMRVATYTVPATEGDTETGECAVFFFGPGQGGDVNSNIDRWAAQFESAGQPEKTTMKVSGMNVTRVQISGTYLSPGGAMMESQGKKANYRLLGAIVEAPEGSVFFKFTGPLKTVEAAEPGFDAMIQSISKP
jgi:hypothetical protein